MLNKLYTAVKDENQTCDHWITNYALYSLNHQTFRFSSLSKKKLISILVNQKSHSTQFLKNNFIMPTL